MKFGRKLEACCARLPQHRDAMLAYKAIKKGLKKGMPDRGAFTARLQKEVDRLNDHVSKLLAQFEHEAALMMPEEDGWAPYHDLARISSACGATIAFIHANQMGLRKIAKKYDKKRTLVLDQVGGLDASPTRQSVMLRWLERASFCTTTLAQLAELQQHLLLACSEDKRHLLLHVQHAAAMCLGETLAGTLSQPYARSPSPPASLTPGVVAKFTSLLLPMTLPAATATGPGTSGAGAVTARLPPPLPPSEPELALPPSLPEVAVARRGRPPPSPVHAQFVRLLLSPDSKLAKQRRFIRRHQKRPEAARHHEPLVRSNLNPNAVEDCDDEVAAATGYGMSDPYGCSLPPMLQRLQPAVLSGPMNGLFT
jgi:hypothetical protein